MQRIRFDRRIIILSVVALVSVAVLVFLDQITKKAFYELYQKNGDTTVIKNFFYFSYTTNSGSAYGLFSDKSWGQLLFKIITPIALLAFVFIFAVAIKRWNKTLYVAMVLVTGGTIGNFIDRIFFSKVTDFIIIRIGGVDVFGVFNLADVFMTFGIILVFVHLLFLDKDGLFKKRNGDKEVSGK